MFLFILAHISILQVGIWIEENMYISAFFSLVFTISKNVRTEIVQAFSTLCISFPSTALYLSMNIQESHAKKKIQQTHTHTHTHIWLIGKWLYTKSFLMLLLMSGERKSLHRLEWTIQNSRFLTIIVYALWLFRTGFGGWRWPEKWRWYFSSSNSSWRLWQRNMWGRLPLSTSIHISN